MDSWICHWHHYLQGLSPSVYAARARTASADNSLSCAGCWQSGLEPPPLLHPPHLLWAVAANFVYRSSRARSRRLHRALPWLVRMPPLPIDEAAHESAAFMHRLAPPVHCSSPSTVATRLAVNPLSSQQWGPASSFPCIMQSRATPSKRRRPRSSAPRAHAGVPCLDTARCLGRMQRRPSISGPYSYASEPCSATAVAMRVGRRWGFSPLG
jgi:hypothetical protein